MSDIQIYFSHDSNARNDQKMLNVRMRHGAEGYGIYFMILERLREEKDYIGVTDYDAIAFDLRVDTSTVKSIINDFGLFVVTDDGKQFYSNSLLKRMEYKDEIRQKRSRAGIKSGEARKQKATQIKNNPTHDEHMLNTSSTRDEQNRNNEMKLNKKKLNEKKLNESEKKEYEKEMKVIVGKPDDAYSEKIIHLPLNQNNDDNSCVDGVCPLPSMQKPEINPANAYLEKLDDQLDYNTSKSKKEDTKNIVEITRLVLDYLNEKAGTAYRANTKSTQGYIKARINDGFALEDFYTVIDKKVAEWKNNADMAQYLRPQTLFGTKFESYLNQPTAKMSSASIPRGMQRAPTADEYKETEWEILSRGMFNGSTEGV